MANPDETSSPEIHCVFVETSLNTLLVLPIHKDEIVSDFKKKLRNEHNQVFPEIGEINVSALKVKRRGTFYHFSESMNVFKAFDGSRKNWFMYVDAVRVQKSELVEKNKEIAVGSVLVDGMDTKGLRLEEGLETKVVEKKTKKRRVTSSNGETSRKKFKVDVNRSVVSSQSNVVSPREKVDDILTGAAIGKVIESGERNDVSMAENQQTSDADKGEVKDVPDNQTVKEALEKLDDLTRAIEQQRKTLGKPLVEVVQKETEMGEKSIKDVGRDNIETDLEANSGLTTTPVTEKKKRRKSSKHHINQPVAATATAAAENIQTDNLVSYPENQLEVSSGLTTGPATEKKKKKKMSSKHNVTAATTTSKEIVNEREKVSGSIDGVDSTSESIPNLRGEKLADTLVDAIQNENKMGKGKEAEEALQIKQKLTREGKSLHCGRCGLAGHNVLKCKNIGVPVKRPLKKRSEAGPSQVSQASKSQASQISLRD